MKSVFPPVSWIFKHVKHEVADLAVMYLRVPSIVDLEALDYAAIADSNFLRQDEVPIGDDVILIGFPASIKYVREMQKWFNIPVFRGGIVSAKYEMDGLGYLLIDAPTYWINSGGPVIVKPSAFNIREELGALKSPDTPKLIGVVSGMLPVGRVWEWTEGGTGEKKEISSAWHSGLSIVVPVDYLIELIDGLPDLSE